MAKTVTSLRLERSVIDALDALGIAGPHQRANRSQVIETILKLFLEQDIATQRVTLTRALGGYRRTDAGDAEAAQTLVAAHD